MSFDVFPRLASLGWEVLAPPPKVMCEHSCSVLNTAVGTSASGLALAVAANGSLGSVLSVDEIGGPKQSSGHYISLHSVNKTLADAI